MYFLCCNCLLFTVDMNESKTKDVDKISGASLGIPRANAVPPVLKEVSKLAAGVAAVATGSATGNI